MWEAVPSTADLIYMTLVLKYLSLHGGEAIAYLYIQQIFTECALRFFKSWEVGAVNKTCQNPAFVRLPLQ